MKILLMAPQPFFTKRGTPIAVRSLATTLAAEGHQVHLLTYAHGERVALPGVRIHRIRKPFLVGGVPIGLSWQKLVCDAALLSRATDLLRQGNFDLIHAVEESAFIALILRARFGIPFVYDMDSILSVQIASMGLIFQPLALLCRALERSAIRTAAGILPVCPALAEYALDLAPGAHVGVLPDTPLQETPLSATISDIETCPGTRILYVGNLEQYQGIELLLSGFRLAAPECPNATLFLIGGSRKEITKLSGSVAELTSQGRVRFLGPRPLGELNSHLRAADILVSSRLLGINTPLKIFSYMESGRAILATRLRTHTQVLDDSTALLVEPTPEGMAAGIQRLVGNPPLRERLGAAARRRVSKEYSPARYRERLHAFYSGLAIGDVRRARLAHANAVNLDPHDGAVS